MINVFPCYGQRGFLIKSDTAFYNVRMKDQGAVKNGLICVMGKRNETQTEYTPYQVKQYGLSNGAVYQAQNITVNGKSKRVFLLRLAQGKVSLYSFIDKKSKERFFLAKDDTTALTEISRNEKTAQTLYNEYVSECAQAIENGKYVTHTRGSLTRFIRDYNKCSQNPLPRLTYGLLVGVSATNMAPANINGVLSSVDFKSNGAFTLGAFLDKPIGAGNFSFHPEILYRQNSMAMAFKNQNVDYDFVVNNSTLTAPLLVQYLLPGVRKRAFVEAGFVYARTLKNENSLYQYTSSGSSVFIEIDDQPVIAKNQIGYSAGGGVRLDAKKKFWLLGVRYSKLYGADPKFDYLSVGEFVFSLGMAF